MISLVKATTRNALTAAVILALAGAAHGQTALGGGRALDGGLNTAAGGRINTSANDLQSIVRFNTNAGNALNGPGYFNAPSTGRFSSGTSSFSSFNRPYSTGTLSDTGILNRSNTAYGSALGTQNREQFDRVAVIEAGYLPGGSLTSSVALPQGAKANDFRRGSEPYVGYMRNNQGAYVMARGSALRGVTLDAFDPPASPGSPEAPKVGSALTYNRVLNELQRAGSNGVDNPNRIDTSANPPIKTAVKPGTDDKPDATKPAVPGDATPPNPIANPATTPGGKAYDVEGALKRLRERLAADKTKTATPTPSSTDRVQPNGVTTSDPSNRPSVGSVTEDDINALRAMSLKLDSLVPPGSTDAQAADGYTRLGQEALAAGQYGVADQMFESAMSRRADHVLAEAGRIHATMGLGLLMTAGGNLRTFFTEHPEMIPVRFESQVLMPAGRAQRIAEMLTTDLDREDGPLFVNGGLTLAYLGRQFDNAEWLSKGLEAMAKQTKDDPQGTELLKIVKAVWSTPAAPSATPVPATPSK